MKASTSKIRSCEICILAGGLSLRMGRDKARLDLGPRTMLGHIRAAAKATRLPVRIIKRDLVSKCGPLGGIYTALKTTKVEDVLFLACDMPFASADLMLLLVSQSNSSRRALFVRTKLGLGFPFLLRREDLPKVAKQLKLREFSLQNLAKILKARTPSLSKKWSPQLQNVNTPSDWEKAHELWVSRQKPPV